MTKLSGSCLCGSVSFDGDTEVKMIINCHCDDCRKVTGSVHGTLLFVEEGTVQVHGETASFDHPADSGNTLTKIFCPNCGSQVAGRNTGRPGMMSIRAGTVDQKDLIKPGVNVFMDSAVPSTPVDPEAKAFPRMPG